MTYYQIDWNLKDFPPINIFGGRGYSTLDGGLVVFYPGVVRLFTKTWEFDV